MTCVFRSSCVVALLCALTASADWLGPKPRTAAVRVVTLAPSLTATVLALGKGGVLVGVSRFDERAEVAALPRVGGFNDPSVEAVVALKPDLVVVQKAPSNQKPVEKMAALGIPVLALPLTTVTDVRASLTEIGAAVGAVEAASKLLASLDADREKVKASAKARGTGPTVLFVYGFAPLVVAGPGSFAHELLEDLGARNVAQKAPTAYPMFSLERAVALRPQLIIDAADVAEGREAVRALKGMKDARWVTLPSRALLQPGPDLGRGLLELEAVLFPTKSDAGR